MISQKGTAGTPLGATAFQQGVQDFMSPYQSQVIDATLSSLIVIRLLESNR